MTILTTIWFTEPRLRRVLRVFGEVIEGIREGHAMAGRYSRLSRLTDDELVRRGLKREDIALLAYRGYDLGS